VALQFENKVVLMVGASGGIGRALATEFSRQGAAVVLVSRDAARLQSLRLDLERFPGSRIIAAADVRVPQQVETIVASTIRSFGRIDVLVNCAGIGMASPVVDMETEDLHDIFETNFFGVFNSLRAVAPHMIERREGLIIQVSSVNGFCAVPLGAAYVSSKFALEGLSRTARVELRRHGVHVLIVRPGLTDTGFFDKAKNFRASDPFPMQRMMSPEIVARKTLEAAARGRNQLVIGIEGKFLWWLSKVSPQLADRLIASAVGRYRSRKTAAETRPLRRSPLSALPRAQTTAPSGDRTGSPSPGSRPTPDRAPRPAAK
jgi:short-subunit dehydrogenase